MRRLVFALLGAALACSSPIEPSVPTLEFEVGIVFGIPTLPTAATPESGALLVTGVLQTQTTGYTLFGTLTVTGPRGLRIDVDAFETVPGFFVATQNYFRARVKNLPAGDLAVEVYHTNHAIPEAVPLRVYHETVRIP
jgi:hypothetical protein